MKIEAVRLCIYPKDVQRITGKSERYSRMLLQKIKEAFSKQEHQFVSVEEFLQLYRAKNRPGTAITFGLVLEAKIACNPNYYYI